MLLVVEIAAQPMHAAADDHEQIVEIVGDAAGQLTDGFEPLRLAQRAFRRLAAVGLLVETPGAPQRHPEDDEHQERRRQPDEQVRSHVRQPLGADRGAGHSGQRIDREAGKLAKADAPGNAVDLRLDRVQSVVAAAADGGAQAAVRAQFLQAVGDQRIAGENRAVVAHQREEAARRLPDQRVKILEISRPHGYRDDAAEGAVRRRQAAGEVEEIGGDARQARRAHVADVSPGVMRRAGPGNSRDR